LDFYTAPQTPLYNVGGDNSFNLYLYHLSYPLSEMSHITKGVLRSAKNYTKGYSDTQAKVRDATSNDPLPPSGAQLNEIAQFTYNQ
jgi:hypothetical protein